MTRPVAEIVRERLLPLCRYDEDSVDTWLTAPHPALDGATPHELIDAGEGEAVLRLMEHISSGAPAQPATLWQRSHGGMSARPGAAPSLPLTPGYDRVVSDTPRPAHEERMEKAKGQYVFLGDYCGRVERVDGSTLIICFDDHTLPGKVCEAHEHFQPLHEQQADLPAERIWADGAGVHITAYLYDPERDLIRMKTERTTRPGGV